MRDKTNKAVVCLILINSVEKSKAWKRTKESQDEESQEENGATEDEATE